MWRSTVGYCRHIYRHYKRSAQVNLGGANTESVRINTDVDTLTLPPSGVLKESDCLSSAVDMNRLGYGTFV